MKRGRPRLFTDEERYERHREAMKRYYERKKRGDEIRRIGLTEEEKKESHKRAMRKWYIKKTMKKWKEEED